jgi:hypothetical protein
VGGDVVLRGLARVDAGDELGQCKRRRKRRLLLRLHHGEVLAHERKVGNWAAEGAAGAGEARGLEIRPPHQAGRTERIQPSRRVQHDTGRDPEAVLERSDRVRDGALELDFARRECAGPELVLQAS